MDRLHKYSGASLFQASLFDADLTRANVSRADLSLANLVGCQLPAADLSRADLSAANLFQANLTEADLTDADLDMANLTGTNLERANLTGAVLGATSLADLQLSDVIGLATAIHRRPSSVGVDTLMRSFRGAGNKLTPELRTFFQGAGVPRELLDALQGILAEVKYYTCFICYGQPDLALAKKLCEDLEGRGVSCWLYDMDKTPGEPTWLEIGKSRREAEKMVVLCSSEALVRDGVLKEIEEQRDEDPGKMVPVSLDNLWTKPGFKVMRGDHDLKPSLTDRNYADFAGWESDPGRYEKGFNELLKALERRDGKAG